MTDADVLVVGGGVAGWCAAWFATRRGRRVTVVDDGAHRASDLPVALINPLRGHTGRLVARGVDGMDATFALVDDLRRRGHAIVADRGLYRPLVDRDADVHDERWWRARVPGPPAFDWHPRAPSSLGLVEPVPAIFLRDAGWVAPAGLLAALAADCAALRIAGRVIRIDPGGVRLADGTTIGARTTLWCGGAWGCAAFDDDAGGGDARYRPGSLVASRTALTTEPMSFGLYAGPWGPSGSTLIGPTREGTTSRFPTGAVPDDAIRHLEDRVARVFGATMVLEPAWRGVRLTRLSSRAADALRGVATLTALGSRGFLMAPLLAAEWARSL